VSVAEFDVRWKQRLQNFEKAMADLDAALDLSDPDRFQRAGLVQFFEMSFELAWKTLKDYLEFQGHQDVSSPRSALKMAFQTGLVLDGHAWMKALEDRNLTSHVYDEAIADQVIALIRTQYASLLHQLLGSLQSHA
jgi:nucleotidyltransferase substrate binding protein (TIGR01987 family)